MPAILTSAYFKSRELFIPNSIAVPDIQDGSVNAVAEIDAFIEKYEKILLVDALGLAQYNLLIANRNATTGKWSDLINGKEYTNKVWLGLKPVIASFVYVKYLENDKSYYTTLGIERSQAKNSVSINPTENIVEVWNNFVEMYQGACNHEGRYLQPIFYFEGWSFDSLNNSPYASLKEYLMDFPADYTFDTFRRYEIKNRWGL